MLITLIKNSILLSFKNFTDLIYSWKDKSYGLVLPKGFIVSYGIAKCIREIVTVV